MVSSYSKKDVDTMIEVYSANPCLEVVSKLSVLLNKPKKSIISKLSKEGVYVTRGYRSKGGEVPITKLQLVRQVEDNLDVKLPGLDKAPKSTLKNLADNIYEIATLVEMTLEELRNQSETNRVISEIEELRR